MKYLFKYSGLCALTVSTITISTSMFQQRFSLIDKRPLSYLGTTSSAHLFSTGLIITASLMMAFYIYLNATYNPSNLYNLSFFIAILGLVVLSVVPDEINGKAQVLHWIAAWAFVISLIASLFIFARDNKKYKVGRSSFLLGKVLAISIFPEIILAILNITSAGSQIYNAIIFGIWIMLVTFAK